MESSKKGNIMHVTKLNADEIFELKSNLYDDFCYNETGLPELTEQQRKNIESAEYPEDIDDEVVYGIYDSYDFVKDDFFCNQ